MKFPVIKLLTVCAALSVVACKQGAQGNNTTGAHAATATEADSSTAKGPKVDINKIAKGKNAEIMARQQVPVLCYHAIRDWRPTDSRSAKDYICPVETFKAHMQILADSGYHPILPDQLYAYLNTGAKLPSKPILLTFDDGLETHATVAAPVLKKHGFKAAFFIMTISMNRPHYITTNQIKELDQAGHLIGLHTYSHNSVKKYVGDDWVKEIDKPKQKLEEIIGKPVVHFAYPFGLWNQEACRQLEKRGLKDAYILSTKRDPDYPLYTIRRLIGSGYWSAKTMLQNVKGSFKG